MVWVDMGKPLPPGHSFGGLPAAMRTGGASRRAGRATDADFTTDFSFAQREGKGRKAKLIGHSVTGRLTRQRNVISLTEALFIFCYTDK